EVVGGLHEQADGVVDQLQFAVGAHGGELGDAAAARIGAEGLQVVEEEAVGHAAIGRGAAAGGKPGGIQPASPSSGSSASMRRASASQSIDERSAWPAVASTRILRCSWLRAWATA